MQVRHVLVGRHAIVEQQVDAFHAETGPAQCATDTLGERQEGVAGGGGKIAQVRGVLAGYDQHVRRSQRKDVQQDDEMLVLEESCAGSRPPAMAQNTQSMGNPDIGLASC